jgi:hypothetical protein
MNLNELNDHPGPGSSPNINRGKDWWAFNKGMKDYLMVYRGKKRRDKPKTNAIANNTMLAPHSAQRIGVTTRP